MKKYVTIQLVVLIFFTFLLTLHAVDGNAKWKGGITYTPLALIEGRNIEFKCTLLIQNKEMQNLKILVTIGSEVLYDKILYYFFKNQEQPIKANWVAKAGSHRITFKIIPTDSVSPDSNPLDNTIYRNFTVIGGKKTLKNPPPSSHQFQPLTPPTNLARSTPKPRIAFAPCTQYQNEDTDLKVQSFNVSKTGVNTWSYSAAVTNAGRRCVKSVVYKITCLGKFILEKRAGDMNSNSFFLPDGANRTISGTFTVTGNLPFYPSGNIKKTKFTFILDPQKKIPDPNPNNNQMDREVVF